MVGSRWSLGVYMVTHFNCPNDSNGLKTGFSFVIHLNLSSSESQVMRHSIPGIECRMTTWRSFCLSGWVIHCGSSPYLSVVCLYIQSANIYLYIYITSHQSAQTYLERLQTPIRFFVNSDMQRWVPEIDTTSGKGRALSAERDPDCSALINPPL